MKRSFILDLIIVILIVALIVTLSANFLAAFFGKFIGIYSNSSSVSKVIMLDAGHGGIDGGAIGSTGTVEKTINLAIAKKAKGYLESQGFVVIMVRETDEGLYFSEATIRGKHLEDLKRRKELIEEYNVDAFLSIHLNKFAEEKYHGAQVFYLEDHEGSKKMAGLLQTELTKVLDRGNKRQEKPSGSYYLFKGNKIPSVIVECGFLSNHEEEQLLKDEEYQNKLAWCIYSGVAKYFNAVSE